MIIKPDSPILVTGATGFIGSKVVECLIDHGFYNLRCLVRPSSDILSTKESFPPIPKPKKSLALI
ncbi:MAG: NAD-dependent epimerase/dehydratase family protein [Deltaproteobacteria bacterium]|nr:NAD-dependent epimerase/dehydratase family protein [Deltaproteobacteria bacterium]